MLHPWNDLGVQTFGLPPSLHVPIAAADLAAIERYVGPVVARIAGRKRPVNAILIEPGRPPTEEDPAVPIWREPDAERHLDRLHPDRQVWVHVDYSGYRRAWIRLGMPEPGTDVFLDHIQNREAVRLGGRHHPYLRLCPVSRRVNTSGGAKHRR